MLKAEKNLNIINIENQHVPIIEVTTNAKQTTIIGKQGIICILKDPENIQTLRTTIKLNKQAILETYNNMTKQAVTDRTEEEYLKICQKYIDHYTNKLQLTPDKIRHTYIKPDCLAWSYPNNTITYNKYMRYMNEDIIKLTVYHELCHLYALKHHGTLAHDEHFFNILYQEYTSEEEDMILID